MRYLHTMVRVKDLDASLDFYCNKLGLEEVRRVESEQGRFTLIFLAAPADKERERERVRRGTGRSSSTRTGAIVSATTLSVPSRFWRVPAISSIGLNVHTWRWRSYTSGRITTFMAPFSSSMVINANPFAVGGRCFIIT